jgi:tyrosyl-tRNA synthetase
MADVIELTRATTVARILERDDFSKRYAAGEPITLTELLYPLMQAYDSVAVEADVELGGTDQLYNLLMGRQIMEYYGKTPQCVLTTPLLVGTDGKMKMSKSLGNYIGVTEEPNNIFGKAMSIPDEAMPGYYSLLVNRPLPQAPPVEQKRELARALVREFHGEEAVDPAEEHFNTVVRRGIPEDVPTVQLSRVKATPTVQRWIVNLIVNAGFAKTNSEARRLIRGGAVRLDGQVITDETLQISEEELDGKILQVGKRRYARLVAGS